MAVDLYQSRRVGLVSATLAIFAGPLLIMYPTIDNFAVFGAAGAVAIWAAIRATRPGRSATWLLISGASVGLATLARVDGLLLGMAPLTAWLVDRGWGPWNGGGGRRLGVGTLLLAGILGVAVMAPWLGRNLATFGSAFPSAGGHTLWITSYNEQFSLSADPTPASYLAWGWANIIGSKLATWWELFWRTVVLLGGDLRRVPVRRLLAGAAARRHRALRDLLAAHVLRDGGDLHLPCAARRLLPLGRGLAALRASRWPWPQPARRSPGVGRWWAFLRRPQTHRFVEVAAVVGAVVLSLVGSLTLYDLWSYSHDREQEAAAYLEDAGLTDDAVLYGDPSSLWHLTGNPGVPAPFDPYPVIEEVVRAYDARWVVVTLREGASADPLGLWYGCAARDSTDNSAWTGGTDSTASWMSCEPAFEADGVRIYAVVE